MWYLQANTLLLIAAFSLGVGILRRLLPKLPYGVLLPIAELALLFRIDVRLCLFYLIYVGLGLLCLRILYRVKRRRVLFVLLCVLAVVPLFLTRSAVFGVTLPFPFVSVGITFQMLKLIDAFYYVYYAGEPVSPLPFLNYMLFLPVFTAGPIFRYRDFLKTYTSPLPLTGALLESSAKRIIYGLFKKVVLILPVSWALERLTALDPHWYVSLGVVICSYLFLYLDLSGYSDVAVGFGRMAGYDVPENFKRPLAAPTFTQFWRSWHATLSDWIREHVYVPLSAHRLGRGASAAVALMTMVLMSLWHGFNLPYLLAGVYNGALLALENLLGLTTVNRRKVKRPVLIVRCLAVNLLFCLNTLVFTLPAETVLSVLRGFLRL